MGFYLKIKIVLLLLLMAVLLGFILMGSIFVSAIIASAIFLILSNFITVSYTGFFSTALAINILLILSILYYIFREDKGLYRDLKK